MTTSELTRKIFLRLGRVKYFIILLGILFAALLYYYAKSKPPTYTSYTSVYPLANTETNMAGGILSTITGGGGGSGTTNLSQDASISLDELANSRNTREDVAMEKLPAFNNKTIAQLLIENENKHLSLFSQKTEVPKDELHLKYLGGSIIGSGMIAKTNKNGLFQIYFTSTDKDLISPISYVLVDKIKEFYNTLKTQKAKNDYEFTVRKIDSIKDVLNVYDRRAINLNNTTMFTPQGKIEYTIPKENLINDKTRVVGLYNSAANNKEEALWRLQRATPILAILDKPDPPFNPTYVSANLYAIIGFFLGCILALLLFVSDILIKFSNTMVQKAVHGNHVEVKTETTVITESASFESKTVEI